MERGKERGREEGSRKGRGRGKSEIEFWRGGVVGVDRLSLRVELCFFEVFFLKMVFL